MAAGRMTDRDIISVWRVIAPPGYGALGDVVSVGLDPPTAPVQVCVRVIKLIPAMSCACTGPADRLAPVPSAGRLE